MESRNLGGAEEQDLLRRMEEYSGDVSVDCTVTLGPSSRGGVVACPVDAGRRLHASSSLPSTSSWFVGVAIAQKESGRAASTSSTGKAGAMRRCATCATAQTPSSLAQRTQRRQGEEEPQTLLRFHSRSFSALRLGRVDTLLYLHIINRVHLRFSALWLLPKTGKEGRSRFKNVGLISASPAPSPIKNLPVSKGFSPRVLNFTAHPLSPRSPPSASPSSSPYASPFLSASFNRLTDGTRWRQTRYCPLSLSRWSEGFTLAGEQGEPPERGN